MTDIKITALQMLIFWGDEMMQEHPMKTLSFADAIDKAEELLEMEKEQMFEFWQGGINCTEEDGKSFDQYYNEIYGSNHIVGTNEMIDHIGDANKMVEAVEKPMRYHCVPKEISDKEIEKIAKEKHIGLSIDVQNYRRCFMQGAKWYREQLKKLGSQNS